MEPIPDPVIAADYLTVHGSRAYLLNTPSSDWDFRGFFLPSAEHLLGFIGGPEQRMAICPPIDAVAWDIRKFFRLAANCNPNVIETLFTLSSHQIYKSPAAERVLENRHLFLSRRARDSFGGYAVGQLKKVRTAKWDEPGTRKDAMHLWRLIDFGKQILEHGTLQPYFGPVQRECLLGVRAGHYSREEVISWAEADLQKLDALVDSSPLPKEPPYHTLDGILIEILQDHLKRTT
jgi:uncharacterized protein